MPKVAAQLYKCSAGDMEMLGGRGLGAYWLGSLANLARSRPVRNLVSGKQDRRYLKNDTSG